jgi:hypothetical protein
MGAIKLNKLFSTFDKNKGVQKTFVINAKALNITINGELHKIDDQYYCFTRGAGKVVVEQEKIGTVLSWRGTRKKYSVKFMIGDGVLAEFEIPENAKLRLNDPD